MRKDITSQTEKACVAYVTASQSATAISTCQVLAGGLVDVPDTITPPFIIMTASAPMQIGFDTGIYELTLTACIATQVDDELNVSGQDVHRERVEVLRDLMENVQAIQAFVNPPASGPDTRTVQSFTLSGIVYEGDETKESGRKLETEIRYYVVACPSD